MRTALVIYGSSTFALEPDRPDQLAQVEDDIVDAVRDGGGFVHLPLRGDRSASILVTPSSVVTIEEATVKDRTGEDDPQSAYPGGWDFDF